LVFLAKKLCKGALARTIRRQLVRPLEQLGVSAVLLDELGDMIPARTAAFGGKLDVLRIECGAQLLCSLALAIARSMRRSGISHISATSTYSPPAIHSCTNADGIAIA
jgi:hypothetical protein